MKPYLKFIIPSVVVVIAVVAWLIFRSKSASGPTPTTRKQLINILPIKDRPFVALFPHQSGKLITLYFDKPGQAQNITIDLEYLSGNALKGGRTGIEGSTFPHTQAFLLGSCSAGGKCSFDTDITSGTIKTKLEIGPDLHLLKSNFVFISKDSLATTDQKAALELSGKSKANLILSETHGYLGQTDQEAAAEPLAITSTSADLITGTLSLLAPDASKVLLFDGSSYKEINSRKDGDKLIIDLKHKPWTKNVTIIRDDLKGATEDISLYLLGPFIPVK